MLQLEQALPSTRPRWSGGRRDPQPLPPKPFPRNGQPLADWLGGVAPGRADIFRPFASTPGGCEPGAASGSSAEQLLLDVARRAARTPGERAALVLHLSRLGPPAPQPHHRRIARALLTEAAQRHDGQLFALGNGDLVLLCRHAPSPARTSAADDPASLKDNLARLFGGESAEPEAMVSLWLLPAQEVFLIAYATEQLGIAERSGNGLSPAAAERRGAVPVTLPAEPAPFAASADFTALLQRRTGALITRSGGIRPHSFRPLFREIALSPAALWARSAPADGTGPDPWLVRHFAHRLDDPLLALIEAALPGPGPLGMAGAPHDFALHVNLSVRTIVKERCAHLFQLCRSIGVKIGVEVSLVEAAAAPEAFEAARAALRRSGFRIVLGGVSHQTLRMVRPRSLDADLLKLDWSARLLRLAEPDRAALAAALGAIGMERVILNRADGEEAVLWGLAQGVGRFVGHHVEVMLAAGRMLTCSAAAGCTLGQCTERAASATAAGRRFCRNPVLLDSGAPSPGPL